MLFNKVFIFSVTFLPVCPSKTNAIQQIKYKWRRLLLLYDTNEKFQAIMEILQYFLPQVGSIMQS